MRYFLFIFMWIFVPSESLKCIQCESRSDDPRPVCNIEYWGQLNTSARKHLVTHCPTSRAAFCITLVKYLGNVEHVVRGCTVDHTDNDLSLKEGCFTSYVKSACLCSTDLCNVSATLFPKFIVIFIILTSLFVNILK